LRAFLKYCFVLFLILTATPFILNYLGIVSFERLWQFLESLPELESSPLVFWGIVLLLAADIILPVPTMTVMMLSGFVMGFWAGALAGSIGGILSVLMGYLISLRYGDALLLKIVTRTEADLMKLWFEHRGLPAVMVARFMPLMPEILSCLCGSAKMPLPRFLLWFGLGTVPHAVLCAFVGSISTLDNPWPAVFLIATPICAGYILRSVRRFEKGSLQQGGLS